MTLQRENGADGIGERTLPALACEILRELPLHLRCVVFAGAVERVADQLLRVRRERIVRIALRVHPGRAFHDVPALRFQRSATLLHQRRPRYVARREACDEPIHGTEERVLRSDVARVPGERGVECHDGAAPGPLCDDLWVARAA